MQKRIEQVMQFPWVSRVLMLVTGICAMLLGHPIALGANEVSTTTLTYDEATEYISEKTLRVALSHLATYQFANKHKLPPHSGRTFQLTRYEKLALPQNPLTQGTPPTHTPMSISRVQAVAEQWGATIKMYDVPLLTIKHDVLTKAINLLGVQAAMVFEREMQRALMACTNTQFVNARASRASLVQADALNSTEIRKAVTNLRKNGATDWTRTEANTTSAYLERMLPDGGGATKAKPGMETDYVGLIGIIDTDVEQDVSSDSTFVNASSYSNIRALYKNEIGKWMGVYWIRSNYMPAITLLASPSCASANMTGMTGGFSASTAYDVAVTKVNENYGLEEYVSANIDVSTDGSGDSIAVTLPSASGYGFRIYVGTDGGTKYLVPTASSATTQAADDLIGPVFDDAQTVYVTALPTSGDTAPVAPASGITVHVTWIFGMDAFGCVDLAKLEAMLTKDEATTDNPLKQFRVAGWKAFFKAMIENNNFVRMIESGSNFAG